MPPDPSTPTRRIISLGAGRGAGAERSGDGWRRVTTLNEPRLSEMAENYRSLGYEVEIRHSKQVNADGCNTCFDAGRAMGQTYGTIYVRCKDAAADAGDELFD